MSYMSENFVGEPLRHFVDVDTNGDVVLYLDGNGEADRLVITMSREQFSELGNSMAEAAKTGLPNYSRWKNGELMSRSIGRSIINPALAVDLPAASVSLVIAG
jgi:hypothetical protein